MSVCGLDNIGTTPREQTVSDREELQALTRQEILPMREPSSQFRSKGLARLGQSHVGVQRARVGWGRLASRCDGW